MSFENIMSRYSEADYVTEIPEDLAYDFHGSSECDCHEKGKEYGCFDHGKVGKEYLGKSVYVYEYYRVGKRKFIEPEMKRCNCRGHR